MGEWTITSLTEYLVNLFITKNVVNEIIKKVDKLSHSLPEEQFLAIGVEQNGKDIKVILKVFDDTKPKCWIEGFQYKFNSYISEIITVAGKHERNH